MKNKSRQNLAKDTWKRD